jgi:hypothetical protein
MKTLQAGILAAVIGVASAPVLAGDATEQVTCDKPSATEYIGPTLTVDEVEAQSLKEIRESPRSPQIPFGYNNAKWLALKSSLKPGDTLHVFQGLGVEGFLAMRGPCVVARIVTSID